MNEPKIITIKMWQGVAIVLTAMLSAAGGGIWAGITTVNSDHFTISALTNEVKEIESDYVRKDVQDEKWKNNDQQHSQISQKLDTIITILGDKKW